MYQTTHLTQDELKAKLDDEREVYTNSVLHVAEMAIAELQHNLAKQSTEENHEAWVKLSAAQRVLDDMKLLPDRITIDGLTVRALTSLAQQYEEGLS